MQHEQCKGESESATRIARGVLHARLAAAVVAAGLAAALGLADQLRADPTRRLPHAQSFALPRLDHALMKGSWTGKVRVAITLAGGGTASAAARLSAGRERALTGRLTRAEAEAVRNDPEGAGRHLARRREAARARALRYLQAAADAAGRRLDSLARAIHTAHGRAVEANPLTGTLTAWVPRRALPGLAARPDVSSVAPSPIERPMAAIRTQSTDMGADAFWSAGHLGGAGPNDRRDAFPNDTSGVDVAVMNDKIQEDQPLFQGVQFLRPQGAPQNPACGQTSPGCEHGTEVAGVIVTRGNGSCSICTPDSGDERGIAYGVDKLLDASLADAPPNISNAFAELPWVMGITQTANYPYTGELPGVEDPAEILSDSHGSYTANDDGSTQQGDDMIASSTGVTLTEPAGNDGQNGTGSDHITSSCIAYNVICAGAVGKMNPGTSDDIITAWSSRGPSPAGRKKPDIVAIGGGDAVSNMTVVEQRWTPSGLNRLTRGDTGTSFASPAVAAGAALLAGYGITDPNARKAILLNSARLGRRTPSDPMGTQEGWQPDWGWGELDLAQAYAERANWQTDEVAGGRAKLYEMTPQAGTDRVTLVWQRRVTGCFVIGCTKRTTYTLTNLDLYAYDIDTQALEGSSTSTIDNVEQVRAQDTSGSPDLLKVKANSTVDGVAAEPFAIDGTRTLTPVTAPEPNATIVSRTPSVVRPGELVTITATIANPSGDLPAPSFSATAAGNSVEVVGAPSNPPSQLAKKGTAGDSTTLTWTVRAPSDGTYTVTIQGQAQSYGETWKGAAASATFTVDGTPPAPTIASPSGSVCAPGLNVAWGAADPAGVASYDVDVQVDGGPFSTWLPGTATTSGSYTGSLGHSYAFRVRATDGLGNLSGFVSSPTATIVDCTPPPGGGANLGGGVTPGGGGTGGVTTPLRRSAPRLALTRAVARDSRLYVSGRLVRGATGQVTATLQVESRVASRAHARIRRSAFRLTLRRPRAARRLRLTIRYSGDHRHLPGTLRRYVRAR